MSSIRLSPKHGLNPTIPKCWFCGEDKNEIMLPGVQGDRIAKAMGYSDGQMPMRGLVFDKQPCDKCQQWMKQGIILIGVDKDRSPDKQNPYRTGKFAVITEDAARRLFKPEELLQHILKARVAFIPDEVWTAAGLPVKDVSEEEAKTWRPEDDQGDEQREDPRHQH